MTETRQGQVGSSSTSEASSAGRGAPLHPHLARWWYEHHQSLLCILGLAVLPFVAFWEVATLQQVPAGGDTTDFYYPAQYFVSQQIRTGNFSLWNDTVLSGLPLRASTGVFYPVTWLLVFLPSWKAMSYSLLLHLSMAGVFTFICARGFGLRRSGALVAGVIFMFSGFAIGHLYSMNIMRTVPWLPLILWAVEQWRLKLEYRYIGVGAVATGFMFLGGHPQIPIFAAVCVVSYALLAMVVDRESGHRIKFALVSGLMLGLGMIIAGPLIWDVYEMSQTSSGTPVGVYDYCTTLSLAPQWLAHMVFPRVFMRHSGFALVELAGYVGILSFPLAILAAFHWKHVAKTFFLLLAGISVLLVLGRYTPLYDLLCRIPIYNAFRVPARHWFEFDFALAILAGAGLSCLADAEIAITRKIPRWSLGLGIVLLASAALIVVGATWIVPKQVDQLLAWTGIASWTHPALWLPLLVLLISAGALFLSASKPARWYTILLIIILLAADLYFSFADLASDLLFTRMSPTIAFAESFEQPPDSVKFLKEESSPYRVIAYSPAFKTDPAEKYAILLPNLSGLFDIGSADGYNGDKIPGQYAAFTDHTITGSANALYIAPRLFDPEHNIILSSLNVKYILVPVHNPLIYSAGMVVDDIRLDNFVFHFGMELGASTFNSTTMGIPAYPATTLALTSYLVDGAALPSGQPVARVTVTDQTGQTYNRDLIAGEHTAEQAYDCQSQQPAHAKGRVVQEMPGQEGCPNNIYFARLELAEEPVVVQSLAFEYLADRGHLKIEKASLYNAQSQTSYPFAVAEGNVAYLDQGQDYRLVYEDRYARIYENKSVLPRALMVPQVEYVAGPREATQILHLGTWPDGRTFSPTKTALVEAPSPILWPAIAPTGEEMAPGQEAQITVISAEPGRNEITVQTDQDAFLVYSESYANGWRAKIDEQPVGVYRTNGALLGVPVPAGQHRVVLSYRRLSFYLAIVGHSLAMIIILGLSMDFIRRHWPTHIVDAPR